MKKIRILSIVAFLGMGVGFSSQGEQGANDNWRADLNQAKTLDEQGESGSFDYFLKAGQGAREAFPLPVTELAEEILPALVSAYSASTPCVDRSQNYKKLLLKLDVLSQLDEVLGGEAVAAQAYWLARVIYRHDSQWMAKYLQDDSEAIKNLCARLKGLWDSNAFWSSDRTQVAYLLAIQDKFRELAGELELIGAILGGIDANFISSVQLRGEGEEISAVEKAKRDFDDISIPEDAFGASCPRCEGKECPACLACEKCAPVTCPECKDKACPECKDKACPECQACECAPAVPQKGSISTTIKCVAPLGFGVGAFTLAGGNRHLGRNTFIGLGVAGVATFVQWLGY